MELAERVKHSKCLSKGIIINLFTILTYFISLILLISGIIKIIDPLQIINTLQLISFLPKSLHLIIATVLPLFEVVLGLLLLINYKTRLTLIVVSLLFLSFFAFSIYGTVNLFEGDCGCFGDVVKSEFDTLMIIRNFMFFLISVILLYKKVNTAEYNKVNL